LNESTGSISIKDSTSTLLYTLPSNTNVNAYLTSNSSNTWNISNNSVIRSIAPYIQSSYTYSIGSALPFIASLCTNTNLNASGWYIINIFNSVGAYINIVYDLICDQYLGQNSYVRLFDISDSSGEINSENFTEFYTFSLSVWLGTTNNYLAICINPVNSLPTGTIITSTYYGTNFLTDNPTLQGFSSGLLASLTSSYPTTNSIP
jgi:hypothetical protein